MGCDCSAVGKAESASIEPRAAVFIISMIWHWQARSPLEEKEG